jgi:hypothetical protein
MGQGKGRQNKVASGNEEDGQTDTREEEKLAATSTEDAIRKSQEEDGFMFEDGTG